MVFSVVTTLVFGCLMVFSVVTTLVFGCLMGPSLCVLMNDLF
ncbi:hypothetical protein Leryth_017309 [Lithospermum erythrorhizon]|nr:hypothetical protein Leryth_017309 [Lithospermum erythrorhizon]